MELFIITEQKESRKNSYPRRDLNPGPQPQSKFDDLDRSAIGPALSQSKIKGFLA